MDTFMITTTGNYEVMVNLFNAITSIFHSHNDSFITTFARFSATMALLGTVMYCLFASTLKPLGMWFVSYLVILNGLFLPVSQVNITDSMTGHHGTVSNVPFGLAVVASGFNQFSHAITQLVDQAFQPTPGAELEQKEPAVSRLTYLQTGFIFGAHALLQMRGLQITNADFANNVKEFVQQCVVIDCLIGSKYTLHDLKTTNDIWGLVSAQASKMRGFSWKAVERDKGALVRSGTQIITCAEGVERINRLWGESTDSTVTTIEDSLRRALGLKGSGHNAIHDHIQQHMPFALNELTGLAQGASDIVKQQMMIDTIVDATERKAVELGAAPNFEARRAYLHARTQNETTGHVIAMTLPYFKTVLEALMYALFLFVFPLSLLPKGWKVLSIWAKGCLWVSLWPPLFAILNFFITEGLRLKLNGAMGAGLSIATSVGVYNAAADMASIAGYLSASIPLLAWWIVDHSTYSLVSMAGSMLASSQSAIAAASQETFAGNYSYGNVNLDNTQGSQTNLFKHDASPSYNAGHFSTNDGTSAVVTGLSGEQILTVARSTLPIEIDSASYQESQARDAYSQEMGVHTTKSQQALQQQTKAAGEYLEFGKQASKMIAKGEHFSTQETAQVTQEAAQVYSRAKSISKRYGLSEDIVNQVAGKIHAGISVGTGDLLKFINISGGASVEKTESSQATLQEALEEITSLGQSSEFRTGMQHTKQAMQSGSLETTDQQMQHRARNMNQRLEESQQHQTEASKALSRAQSLSHTMEQIRGNSQRINLVETQAFTNYASEKLGGIEAVEEMSVSNPHHLRALGDQYLQEKYGSSALSVTQKQLEAQYDQTPAPSQGSRAPSSLGNLESEGRQAPQAHEQRYTSPSENSPASPSYVQRQGHSEIVEQQPISISTPVQTTQAQLETEYTHPAATDTNLNSVSATPQPIADRLQESDFIQHPQPPSPQGASTGEQSASPTFSFFDEETGDKRIKPQPLNKPSAAKQVQQMISLTSQRISGMGSQLKGEVTAASPQFGKDKQTFENQKLGVLYNTAKGAKSADIQVIPKDGRFRPLDPPS